MPVKRPAQATPRSLARAAILAAVLPAQLLAPLSGEAQVTPADSLALLDEARDVQARYERFREQRTPPSYADLSQRCDDVVGRFCFRFELHEPGEEWTPPEQPIEVELAPTRVIRDLRDVVREIPGDRWVAGQLVYYLGVAGAWRDAASAAGNCRAEAWWCVALLGYVYHAVGEWEESERIFERALEEMPVDTAAAWIEPKYILRRGADDVFQDAADKRAAENRLWLLSDPLYLVAGNDRKTEQYSRQVLIRIRSGGESGTGQEWDEDLDEITLLWGAPQAWTREQDRPNLDQEFSVRDTRKMISHRWGMGFLPNAKALADPAELRPGDWELGGRRRLELRDYAGFQDPLGLSQENQGLLPIPRTIEIGTEEIMTVVRDAVRRSGPRTGYTPAYADRFDRLDTQVARFRRGDSLLVVGAYAPAPEREKREGARLASSGSGFDGVSVTLDLRARRRESRSDRQKRMGNPFAVEEELPEAFPTDTEPSIEAGLFLINTDDGVRHEVRADTREGAFQLQVPNGRYVVGLETFSPTEKRAWRERHGAWQESVVPGLAVMSDLLILQGGRPIPESLDEALPHALPSLRIAAGDAIQVAWELYGLRIGETAEVRIGVNEVSVGVLSTIGQFLRMIEPENPVAMSWQEAGPDVLGTVFRAVELNLPELEPGDYELAVEVEPRGREPMRVTRRITIVEGG